MKNEKQNLARAQQGCPIFNLSLYSFSSFWGEFVPGLANHFCELPFSIWVARFEHRVCFCEKEIVATPVGFRTARITRPSSCPTTWLMKHRSIRYECSACCRGCRSTTRIARVVEHAVECLVP